jgi:hypothetical protein
MTKLIALVGCTSRQHAQAMPARWLYHSEWFIRAAAVAETASAGWFILSARYGLLHPDQKIAPYDLILSDLSPSQRKVWAAAIVQSLAQIISPNDRLLLLADPDYHVPLLPLLENCTWRINAPLTSLSLAGQIAWMDNALDSPVPRPESN